MLVAQKSSVLVNKGRFFTDYGNYTEATERSSIEGVGMTDLEASPLRLFLCSPPASLSPVIYPKILVVSEG
jgi:hypothetical protein